MQATDNCKITKHTNIVFFFTYLIQIFTACHSKNQNEPLINQIQLYFVKFVATYAYMHMCTYINSNNVQTLFVCIARTYRWGNNGQSTKCRRAHNVQIAKSLHTKHIFRVRTTGRNWFRNGKLASLQWNYENALKTSVSVSTWYATTTALLLDKQLFLFINFLFPTFIHIYRVYVYVVVVVLKLAPWYTPPPTAPLFENVIRILLSSKC